MFITFNHSILLDKSNFYGFRGLINDWFQSYLKNRTQTIQIGEYLSTKRISPRGVLQGLVLGPLLFLLYINDIHLDSSDKLKFYLFAGENNILYPDKNLEAVEQTVNAELKNVHDWLTTNKLTLNTKKSNFVIFRPCQKKKKHFSSQISILDCETNKRVSLEQKSYVKYLGVLIDENLPWKSHVDSVIIKISKTIGMIAKVRYIVPSTVLINIYNSLKCLSPQHIFPVYLFSEIVLNTSCYF